MVLPTSYVYINLNNFSNNSKLTEMFLCRIVLLQLYSNDLSIIATISLCKFPLSFPPPFSCIMKHSLSQISFGFSGIKENPKAGNRFFLN